MGRARDGLTKAQRDRAYQAALHTISEIDRAEGYATLADKHQAMRDAWQDCYGTEAALA